MHSMNFTASGTAPHTSRDAIEMTFLVGMTNDGAMTMIDALLRLMSMI